MWITCADDSCLLLAFIRLDLCSSHLSPFPVNRHIHTHTFTLDADAVAVCHEHPHVIRLHLMHVSRKSGNRLEHQACCATVYACTGHHDVEMSGPTACLNLQDVEMSCPTAEQVTAAAPMLTLMSAFLSMGDMDTEHTGVLPLLFR